MKPTKKIMLFGILGLLSVGVLLTISNGAAEEGELLDDEPICDGDGDGVCDGECDGEGNQYQHQHGSGDGEGNQYQHRHQYNITDLPEEAI